MSYTLTAETELAIYHEQNPNDPDAHVTEPLGSWCVLNYLDVDEVLAELRSSGEHLVGGGAAPLFVIRAVSGSLIGRYEAQ